MGNDVMCKAKIWPTIDKAQYRFSTFFPEAEVSGAFKLSDTTTRHLKGSHVIGESTYLWGEWRNKPGVGEDFVYLVWRWTDCCAIAAPSS